uniref:Nodule-specific cysteine-rich peptide L50 n=1 Tax=Lens culinaris TaxID=3864 RepID=A0A7T8DVA4_LENCU|nr:nodule-specific cysteine-rich peptide L50 [Lens culinaris]
MTQILMLVYALVIILFLFLVESSKVYEVENDYPCKTLYDCPELTDHFVWCIEGFCDYGWLNN